jgi:hypothetical protein
MPTASSGAISVGNAAGSDRSINEELGITHNTANSSMTTVVTAAVTGSTPRGSGTVTEARPHAFSEWHSYTHTQTFGTPTYYIRNAASNPGVGVQGEMIIFADECQAGVDTVFYMKLNGTVVEFWINMDHDNTGYYPIQPNQQVTFYRPTPSYVNTSGTDVNFSGSWGSGWTDVKIAQLETSGATTSEVRARIYGSVTSDVGTWAITAQNPSVTLGNSASAPNTSWADTGWRTPHASTKYGIAPAAFTMPQACYDYQENAPEHTITCQVGTDDGSYETKTLNLFKTFQEVTAGSTGCE